MSPTPYYNPPDDVFSGRIGRKLQNTEEIPRPFEHYFAQLRSGEIMYAGLSDDISQSNKLVAYAHTKQWYDYFYQRYFSGRYVSFDVYALPTEVVEA